jgi:FkbM family methyltransferase
MDRGIAMTPIAAGRNLPGLPGHIGRSVAYRLSMALARTGRPIVRGRLRSGSRIYLDIRDPAQREIFWTGQTEPGTAMLLRRLITSGCSVVDVGANVGFYSLTCADVGAARVLAFEPNPRTARLLRRSTEGTAVEVVGAACGQAAGVVTLYFSPNPAKAAFSTIKAEARHRDDSAAWGNVEVPLVTVDDECSVRDLRPDVVKIDAEGAEYDVLLGMTRLLEHRVPRHVVMELGVGWERPDPRAWLALLHEAGYEPATVQDHGSLVPLGSLEDQTVQNVCFTRARDY